LSGNSHRSHLIAGERCACAWRAHRKGEAVKAII
jgi:hypothetical protein